MKFQSDTMYNDISIFLRDNLILLNNDIGLIMTKKALFMLELLMKP